MMMIKKTEHKAQHEEQARPPRQTGVTEQARQATREEHLQAERVAQLEVSREREASKAVPQPTFHDLGHAAAEALAQECATPEARKVFYAGDGVARATALRDQALALAMRFSTFIRA